MMYPKPTVEPDLVPIPATLALVIDQLIEVEQRRTGEKADQIRERFRSELIERVRDWAEQKQRHQIEAEHQ